MFFGSTKKKIKIAIIFETELKQRKIIINERKVKSDIATECSPSAQGRPVEPYGGTSSMDVIIIIIIIIIRLIWTLVTLVKTFFVKKYDL